MASLGMQMLASSLSLLGWVGVILTCSLPMWRVTAFIGSTIITSQTYWEGIWMICVVESTGQIQCKPYESVLALSSDLQAARAITALAIATGAFGLLLAFVGGKCTIFLDEEGGGVRGRGSAVKGRIAVAAGALLIVTGVLCLIPTSWAAGSVVQGFYSAISDAQRRELGACLYIGWGSSILLILGGGLFISSTCPLKPEDERKSPSVHYMVVRSSNGAASSLAASSRRSRGPSINGPHFTRSHGSEATPSMNHPRGVMYTQPGYGDGLAMVEQDYRLGSGWSQGSKASSTKSQLKRMESRESLSESDKSAPSQDTSNPTKSYI
ncbi:claudin-4 [Esox lucius]|uniref:claudin-4 n=1 Tax=Esox lucius TaxID=8010 RepID=UPI0014769CB6|nr:claudin-4 [Esox lucius]